MASFYDLSAPKKSANLSVNSDLLGQAKQLAAGEDTEFSKRVDKGGVY